jgi:hypothetical protein
MQEQINELAFQVEELKRKVENLSDYSEIPLEHINALTALGFARFPNNLGTGVVLSNGDGTFSILAGQSGSYYVATISGGAVNHFIQISNGILTTS